MLFLVTKTDVLKFNFPLQVVKVDSIGRVLDFRLLF